MCHLSILNNTVVKIKFLGLSEHRIELQSERNMLWDVKLFIYSSFVQSMAEENSMKILYFSRYFRFKRMRLEKPMFKIIIRKYY